MKKRFLGILLSLVMVLGLMPGMSLTAMAIPPEQKPGNLYEYDNVGIGQLYNLWVGGTQVTSANAGNIDGNNKASYNAETKTLTLNGYSYNGQGYGDSEEGVSGSIYAGSGSDLNIVLSGTNSVTIENPTQETGCAVYIDGNLTISGSGTLNAHGKKHGIYSHNSITINGGSVTAESPTNGMSAVSISITGGTVKAKGDSIGISAPASVLSISGGEVTAEGKNYAGIAADPFTITGGKAITSGKNGIRDTDVIIEGGELIASGEEMGIHTYSTTDNNVKNAIPGNGWSDTAGTQGKATIAISTGGQNISGYKKIQFPAAKEPSTVTKNPEAKNLTYTGSTQALVEAGTASGGTMQYALGTKDAATGTYSASIPTGTKAGTYYVWYKVVGDANHSDTDPRCISVTITDYSYISGAEGTWQMESGGVLSFQIKNVADDSKTYEKFQSIFVDGKKVSETDYKTKRGSVIIELQPAYLETVNVGKHTLRVKFSDGIVETTFTIVPASVKADSLPQTGDNSRLLLWIGLVIGGLVGVLFFARKRA